MLLPLLKGHFYYVLYLSCLHQELTISAVSLLIPRNLEGTSSHSINLPPILPLVRRQTTDVRLLHYLPYFHVKG
jgi:hypothetical protein